MRFNITGKYLFKQDGKIIKEGYNLITFLGESFFINRCINDQLNPIQSIVLGNATSIPLRTDKQLGNETIRKVCMKTPDLENKCIKLQASFTASEIVGTTEIGVVTDKLLISHDVFEKIDESLLVNLIGTVEVEYTFQLSTSTIRKGWLKVNDTETQSFRYTYRIYEPSYVTGVTENTSTGYRKVASKELVEQENCSYYYDVFTQNLYIHTLNNSDPNNEEILIETKEYKGD